MEFELICHCGKVAAKAAVQADQLAVAVKELRADAHKAEEAAAKALAAADPIEAFRKRLRS